MEKMYDLDFEETNHLRMVEKSCGNCKHSEEIYGDWYCNHPSLLNTCRTKACNICDAHEKGVANEQ
jgi:hypothetical protein